VWKCSGWNFFLLTSENLIALYVKSLVYKCREFSAERANANACATEIIFEQRMISVQTNHRFDTN